MNLLLPIYLCFQLITVHSLEAHYPTLSYTRPLNSNTSQVQYIERRLPSGQLQLLQRTHDRSINAVLPLSCNPRLAQIIPGTMGVSFVDDGVIKSKFFHQRSSRIIDPEVPLYDIASLEWLNDSYCIINARIAGCWSVVQMDTWGRVTSLFSSPKDDFFHPIYHNEMIWCLQRTPENTLFLQGISYAATKEDTIEDKSITALQIPVSISSAPVALIGINTTKIICVILGAINQDIREFRCYSIEQQGTRWVVSSELFRFFIPDVWYQQCKTANGNLGIFCPTYTQSTIFYVSYNKEAESLNLYLYDISTTKTCLINAQYDTKLVLGLLPPIFKESHFESGILCRAMQPYDFWDAGFDLGLVDGDLGFIK